MHFAVNSIQVVSAPQAADDAERWASAERIHVWRIDLSGVQSQVALLDAIGKGLSSPDYSNLNWDSLEECLRDFDEGKGWLSIFEHTDSLLLLPQQDLATCYGILADAAEFWRSEGRIFAVLFVGGPSLNEVLSGTLGRFDGITSADTGGKELIRWQNRLIREGSF
jgi:hypothetical protein